MKRGEYLPERGDIVWLNFTPKTGHEQRGRRPALILSDQIKSLDFVAREAAYICKVPYEVLRSVQKNVSALVE